MGLFDFLKSKPDEPLTYAQILSRADTIEENEKKYYQSDEYYTKIVHPNSPFESKVILFEDRVKTSVPSSTGLYVPEILMLHFCKSFPEPKRGYPGYWWFKYGVRNVGAMLKSLEERGYIEINSKSGKYQLTEKGKTEEDENEYVYYMHAKIQDVRYDAWIMNEMLGYGDKSKFMDIINQWQAIDEQSQKEKKKKDKETLDWLKKVAPEIAEDIEKTNKELDEEDKYIKLVNEREAQYRQDNDIEAYILFWEDNWKNNRPLLGSHWAFVLPDLYIKTKRYDDALKCLEVLKKNSYYADKAEKYYQKIISRKK